MTNKLEFRALAALWLGMVAPAISWGACNNVRADIDALADGQTFGIDFGTLACIFGNAELRSGAVLNVGGELDIGDNVGGILIPGKLDLVGSMQVSDGTVYNFDTFNNKGSTFLNLVMTSGSSWQNYGLMRNSSGINSYGFFYNNGYLYNDSALYSYGALQLGGAVYNSPDAQIVVRGDLRIDGNTFNYGLLSLEGQREYRIDGHALGVNGSPGTLTLFDGNIASAGIDRRQASRLWISPGTTLVVGDGWSGSIQTLPSPYALPLYTNTRLPSALQNEGRLVVASLGTVEVGELVNKPHGSISNAGQLVIGGLLTNDSELVNSGYLSFFGHRSPVNDGTPSTLNGQLLNTGTLFIYQGSLVGAGALIQTSGAAQLVDVDVAIGSLEVSGGSFCATGSLAATAGVHMAGSSTTLCPGYQLGALRIGSNLKFDGAELDIEIADISAGRFDTLLVQGFAAFNGGLLKIRFIDGYTPHLGDSWSFMTLAGGSSGLTSLSVQYLGLPPGYDVSMALRDDGATLSIVGVPSAVAEPARAALSMLGVFGVAAFVARRRKHGNAGI